MNSSSEISLSASAQEVKEGSPQTVAFDWKVASWSRLFKEMSLMIENKATDRRVLEIGANNGELSLYFSMLGCQVMCSDINATYVVRARQLHGTWGQHCAYFAADMRVLPLRSGSFDLVIMKSVLGGIYSRDGRDTACGSLTEIHRVLRKGGYCILLEQLEGDPLSRWFRSKRFPTRNWHYFRTGEFNTADASSLLQQGFEKVHVRCLTLLSHILEERLSSDTALVRMACALDRVLERIVADDWKHLIGVVAIK